MTSILVIAMFFLLVICFFAGAMIVAAIEVEREQREYLENDKNKNLDEDSEIIF